MMILDVITAKSTSQEGAAAGKLAFSVEEVSEQTTLSKAYLRQKIREEELKATYFGRRVVILREDLEAFLKKGSK